MSVRFPRPGAAAAALALAVGACPIVFAQTAKTPKGPVVGILHALHATTSVETTAAFYNDVFGFAGEPRSFPNPAVPLLTNSPGVSLRNLIYRMTFAGFNYELTEFSGVERHAAQAQVTDPGAMRLTFVVRDMDGVVAALKGRGASVLTLGAAPVTVGKGAAAHRVFVVRDPDGFIVEVEEDARATPQLGRVASVRMGITAKDIDETIRFWNGQLGFELTAPKGFTADHAALAALGIAGPVTMRTASGVVPGTTAAISFTQFKGAPEGRALDLRVPDPGAAGMAIRVQHVDDFLPKVKAAGYRVISKDGVPVQFAANSRNVFVKDPNGLNVELVDAPAAAPRPPTAQ